LYHAGKRQRRAAIPAQRDLSGEAFAKPEALGIAKYKKKRAERPLYNLHILNTAFMDRAYSPPFHCIRYSQRFALGWYIVAPSALMPFRNW
jgi:hypothetical protein